jgi:hypothetical protein
MAKADADRAARLAGHKSLFRRLLERLRPHGQQPISDSAPGLLIRSYQCRRSHSSDRFVTSDRSVFGVHPSP